MKIGNVVITTQKAQQDEISNAVSSAVSPLSEDINKTNEQLANLANYIADGVQKANEEAGEHDATVGIYGLNKNTSLFGLPFAQLYSSRIKRKRGTDMQILRFWSDELPLAPQAIEYVVKSVWARGYSITPAKEGAKDKQDLKNRIDVFFRRANGNNQTLRSILEGFMRHEMRVGNGYIEKIYNKAQTNLAEVRGIKPWNVVVLVNEEDEKNGILNVTGYAKVTNINHVDFKKIPDSAKIKKWKMIHGKYIDEGDAYGISPFSKNQEITKFIINVLNMNQKKFTNEIRHSIHIHLGRKATQTDADIFIAQYRAKYLGQNNYGVPLITFGDIEVNILDMEDKEFDFKEFLKEVGMNHAPTLLNISPSEIINNDAKYSNASQGHITTVLNTIYDWQDRIENIINYEIIPELEGIVPDKDGNYPEGKLPYYKFVLERENLFTMYQHLAGIVSAKNSAIISPNEAREILDSKSLAPIEPEDGMDDSWADDHWQLVGKEVINMDEESFMGTDDSEDTGAEDDEEGVDQEGKDGEDKSKEKKKPKKQEKMFTDGNTELARMSSYFDKSLQRKAEKDKLKTTNNA